MKNPTVQSQLFIVSGVSGSGKTSVIREILKIGIVRARFSRSCTTRPQREDDVAGWSYEYLSNQEFSKMALDDEFAESAEVHGNFYGTPWKNLYESGLVFLDIDVQGCMRLRQVPELESRIISVFLKCTNEGAFAALSRRPDLSIKEKEIRVENAMFETELALSNPDLYDHVFESVHGKLDDLVLQVSKIVPR